MPLAMLSRPCSQDPTRRRPGLVLPRRGWLGVLCLCSLLCLGAGPPVLSGAQPGSLTLDRKQLAAQQRARQLPALSASAALLADSGAGQVLLAANADQPQPMASTTKIMTALLALERANLQDEATVSPTALVGESTMGLAPGEVLTVEELLWGLLLTSANDASVALAEHVAGNEADFVALMNQRAGELGLNTTHFANPHGIDAPGHVSSALDLWRLSEAAMAYPAFRDIVATRFHNAAGRPLYNSNELLGRYPGADGVKTGTTDQAGECLVASVTQDDHRVMATVLGSQNRYGDVEALFDHYFAHYLWAPAPQPAGATAWLRASDGRSYRVMAPEAPDLFLARWQWPLVRTQVVLSGAPTAAGRSPGVVRWYLGNALLGEAPAMLSEY